MAFDFSKFNFFNRLNARARVFFLLAGVVAIALLFYVASLFLGGGEEAAGPSRIASAPPGLQSVPGGAITPEYQRAVEEASAQRARQAQITGTSAVPTMISIAQQPQAATSQCVICYEEEANVKNTLDNWVGKGEVTPEVASALQQLADKNASVDEYAAELDRLVREGKLTPEQARQLLEQYKKQHANRLLKQSADTMDSLIKSGQLPIDSANQLLDAQKKKMSPAEYAAMLQEMVRQGKISPAVAQQLLAQYTQQRAKEIVMKSIASLQKMAREGKITPDVEKELIDLENRMVPVDTYTRALQQNVSQGKLTPVVAKAILDEYKSQKAEIGPTGSINQMLQQAEAAAYGEINDLMREGKMSQAVGAQLTALIQKNIPLEQYKGVINQLVQEKKITPEIAKLKIGDYEAVKHLREMSQKLSDLQGNNAPASVYAEELKKAVQAGALTPEQASQLMQEYAAMTATPAAAAAGPTTEEFARLQQRVQQADVVAAPAAAETDFAVAQARAEEEAAQDRQARIQALMTAMTGQAQQLIASWQPPVMAHTEGAGEDGNGKDENGKALERKAAGAAGAAAAAGEAGPATPPLIKAGTILFAVLDTAINSDYPDSPVMATIVDGKYKGAKLLGKIVTTKGVSGQLDRVSLNFTMMNMDDWTTSKTVTAYAIDPDTARTVMASEVDYHYLQRFGAMMATSFLQGYASAITNAGTSTTGIFGTSTTHPELSPSQKLAVALGQMGQTLGEATQNYINRPPTVRVDSGVGLGILFMADVS
ncbi:TrbI/VirB10 family protein [Aquicella lusitana]|uniref:Type IV secretory pathway VirB10-like protein n=1 Tax=Aquicella lusitana TaxID=254246 RepID=A0A370GZ91_9COXI|nr:TrbI/VirB10 family protein [Aquicella lusitana]RDI48616.1 type IV secretory pathway VirB10-like protein [Aquicella lusitana]VVC74007.1 hypothetical protein AQULUS_17690 [Aquicella lusitana]